MPCKMIWTTGINLIWSKVLNKYPLELSGKAQEVKGLVV